jgi:hypothetical protein
VRGARNGHTTALFADECQSFLDNVIAGLGRLDQGRIPRIGSQGRPGRSATARIYQFAMDRCHCGGVSTTVVMCVTGSPVACLPVRDDQRERR